MKKNLLFIGIIILFVLALGCQKKKVEYKYNASIRIDSMKQDSSPLALSWIKGTVKVYYSVLNNDGVDIHCYGYNINALNVDSSFFALSESHDNVVQKNSSRHDSTKIGVGNARIARAYFNNIVFQ
jgi:hypothetical protein